MRVTVNQVLIAANVLLPSLAASMMAYAVTKQATAAYTPNESLSLSVGSSISIGQCAINGDSSWELFAKDKKLAELCKTIWVENPWLLFPYRHDALIPDQWHPQRKTK